jgi:hypothetical protein
MENSAEGPYTMATQPRHDVVDPTMCRCATGFIRNDLDDGNFLELVKKR